MKTEQQVVRGDHKACPAAGCQPADLLSKVAGAREDHLMPAPLKAPLEHPEQIVVHPEVRCNDLVSGPAEQMGC